MPLKNLLHRNYRSDRFVPLRGKINLTIATNTTCNILASLTTATSTTCSKTNDGDRTSGVLQLE